MDKNEIKYQPTDTAGNPYTMTYDGIRLVIAERVTLRVSSSDSQKWIRWYYIAVCPFCGEETVLQMETQYDYRAIAIRKTLKPTAVYTVDTWKQIQSCVHGGSLHVLADTAERNPIDRQFVVEFSRANEDDTPF
jgi:phage terminase large subunit GpA-like protein